MLLGKMAFGILAKNNIVGYDSILAKMDYLALKADTVVLAAGCKTIHNLLFELKKAL